MISIANFDPEELGFSPAKFPSFRMEQVEAIEQIANGEKRFQALCVPTGGGKSLIAAGAAKVTGLRTVILTATKGLQQQYLDDFQSVGMVDIRGKSNYQCADKDVSCRFGAMEGCRLTNRNGCVYECARDVAIASDLVVTNYAYWLRANERRKGGQELWCDSVELLICDEGHAAMQQLSNAIQVVLRESWLREAGYRFKATDDLAEWAGFAEANSESIKIDLKESIKELQRKPTEKVRKRVIQLEELDQALDKIWSMASDGWVCDQRDGRAGQVNARSWEFDCLWPGAWAEGKLFCGVPKVVLMSATLRPASLGMLGVGKGDFEYREWDRVFPAQNTPVYHVPTVRMNWRTGEEDLKRWVERIDAIIEQRPDRKGIVHTVSFSRQQYLLSKSRFAGRMLVNSNEADSPASSDVCVRFKESPDPLVLVSPSFSTGWDFPGRECEFQIIAKVPYPYSKTKVMKARMERNPRYSDYLAMQDLIQACGRGTRFADDRCEIFIVDDQIGWFMKNNKAMAPRWFEVIPASGVPAPGPRAPLGKSVAPDWKRGSEFSLSDGVLEW